MSRITPTTKGQRSLIAAMTARKLTQRQLAETLSVGQQSVSAWLLGKTRPEAHYREAIATLFSIDPRDWMTADERRIATKNYAAA